MHIIGITGQKYNGKDTAADYLVSKYGFIKLNFAGPIKDICKILFGFSDEQLFGSLKESVDSFWGIKPREVFQYFGTEIMRKDIQKLIPNIEENFWIKCVQKQINELFIKNPDCKIVISDVRFFNELNMINSLKHQYLKVGETKVSTIRIVRPSIKGTDTHISEQQIPLLNVKYEIINDSSCDELYKKIDELIIN